MANLTLNGITPRQLDRPPAAADQLRRLRGELDASGSIGRHRRRTERALGVLTSSKLLDALDLEPRRPDKVRARYGDGKPYQFQYDGAPTVNDQLLHGPPAGGGRRALS